MTCAHGRVAWSPKTHHTCSTTTLSPPQSSLIGTGGAGTSTPQPARMAMSASRTAAAVGRWAGSWRAHLQQPARGPSDLEHIQGSNSNQVIRHSKSQISQARHMMKCVLQPTFMCTRWAVSWIMPPDRQQLDNIGQQPVGPPYACNATMLAGMHARISASPHHPCL